MRITRESKDLFSMDKYSNQALLDWVRRSSFPSIQTELPSLIDRIKKEKGIQFAVNFLNRLEVSNGYRKPTIGLYDHAMHFIGGAQKYGCTIASILQEDFDVTLIVNKSVTVEKIEQWYNLDLSSCKILTVPIPFFEKNGNNYSKGAI